MYDVTETGAAPFRPGIAASEIGPFVFSLPRTRVSVLAGLGSEALRAYLDAGANPSGRSALFLDIAPRHTADAIVGDVIGALGRAARDMWPLWFACEDLADIPGGTLGRQILAVRLDRLGRRIPALSAAWAERAAARVLDGKLPRVPDVSRAIEIGQLSLVLNPAGLVLVTRMEEDSVARAEAFIAALEWIARTADMAVLILCPRLPPAALPFDRLLSRASVFSEAVGTADERDREEAARLVWIAPLGGRAHPLSEVEKRMEKLVRADPEIGPLFAFNRLVQTVRGGRYRVDLVWTEGRVVVELDGFDHAERGKFIEDRHRDYELMLDGYRVLRIANDEAAQDYERAVEKIRAVVRLQRDGGRQDV